MEVKASEIFEKNFDALYETVNVKVDGTDKVLFSGNAFHAQSWINKNKKDYQNLIITDNHRVIENVGGSRSSKTWSIIQLLFYHALNYPNQRISIVRKTLTALNKAMSKDIEVIIDDFGIRHLIEINKTNKTYSFSNGSMIELMGANDADRLRGTARDVLFVDEATELLSDDWLQLIMRTRVKAFISYNPAGNFVWIDKILPENKITIHSTYKDNPFLPYFQIKELLDLKEVNEGEYNIYALGVRASTKDNVYDHFRMVDDKPERFKNYIYGLDFGYNHPTALVRLWYFENELYIEPVIYESHLNTTQLIERFEQLGIEKNIEIPADYSRPEIINELCTAGYQIINADKKVLKGINLLKATKVFFNKKDENTLKEFQMYKWKKVRDIILDEPIKQFDDILDAVRYGNMWIAAYYR
jgi:phage terminase large subunit